MLNINVHVQKRIEIVWAEQGLSSIFVLKLWTATSLNQIHTSNEFKIQVSHRLVKRYYGNYKTSGERNLHRLMSNLQKNGRQLCLSCEFRVAGVKIANSHKLTQTTWIFDVKILKEETKLGS